MCGSGRACVARIGLGLRLFSQPQTHRLLRNKNKRLVSKARKAQKPQSATLTKTWMEPQRCLTRNSRLAHRNCRVATCLELLKAQPWRLTLSIPLRHRLTRRWHWFDWLTISSVTERTVVSYLRTRQDRGNERSSPLRRWLPRESKQMLRFSLVHSPVSSLLYGFNCRKSTEGFCVFAGKYLRIRTRGEKATHLR